MAHSHQSYGRPTAPTHPSTASDNAMTGAMTAVMERCNASDTPPVMQLFTLLGTIDRTRRTHFLIAFGLNGDAISTPDLRHLKQVGIRNEDDARNRINDIFRELHRLGFASNLGFSWLRDLLLRRLTVVTHARQHLLPVTPRTHDHASPNGAFHHLDPLIEQQSDTAIRSDLDALARALGSLSTSERQHFVYCYGLDMAEPGKRREGQLVEYLRARNGTDAQQRIERLWDGLHREGLPKRIDESWFLGTLHPPKPQPAPHPDPAPTAASDAPPAPKTPAQPASTAVPTAARETNWHQFSDILGRRMFPEQQTMLITFIEAVEEHLDTTGRARMHLAFGLRNGTRPLKLDALGAAIGLTTGSSSEWMQRAFRTLYAHGLNPAVTAHVVRGLVYALNGMTQKGVRIPALPDPLPDAQHAEPSLTTVTQQQHRRLHHHVDIIDLMDRLRQFMMWLSKQPPKVQVVMAAYYGGITAANPPQSVTEIGIRHFGGDRTAALAFIRQQRTAFRADILNAQRRTP